MQTKPTTKVQHIISTIGFIGLILAIAAVMVVFGWMMWQIFSNVIAPKG